MAKNDFIGRKDELAELNQVQKKRTSSLIAIKGRRRIGKSRLVHEFSSGFKNFIEFQGLPPLKFSERPSDLDDLSANKRQLEHFSNKMSIFFSSKKEHFDSWLEAFHALAQKTKNGKWLIFIDEISWMGMHDPFFAGALKEIWDSALSRNRELILIVCGSVSAWIDKNITRNIAFEGRLSIDITLQELSLPEVNQFFQRYRPLGTLEKMWLLSVTGGVPMYLEEALSSENQMQSLVKKCFSPNQFFFNEFDKIFSEIFMRRAKTMEKIVRLCLEKKLTPAEVAKGLQQSQSQDLTENIRILELSGFVSRDYFFTPGSKVSKLSQIRLKDNYLRFYLKYIEPLKLNIKKGGRKIQDLTSLPNYEAILGYQFENLILGSRRTLYPILNLNDSLVLSAAPYAQKKNLTNKGACQIDLLIHTKLDVFYVCEFKCKRLIEKNVIREIESKISKVKWPSRSAVKPVLIYLGEIHPNHEAEMKEYFLEMISFEKLLEK